MKKWLEGLSPDDLGQLDMTLPPLPHHDILKRHEARLMMPATLQRLHLESMGARRQSKPYITLTRRPFNALPANRSPVVAPSRTAECGRSDTSSGGLAKWVVLYFLSKTTPAAVLLKLTVQLRRDEFDQAAATIVGINSGLGRPSRNSS